MENDTTLDIPADTTQAPVKAIPNPPGGGSWKWDEAAEEWIPN